MPKKTDGLTKAEIIRLYDTKLVKRAVIAEERIQALEVSVNQLTKELAAANAQVAQVQRKNVVQDNVPVYQRPTGTKHYADSARYKGVFGVPSATTPGREYIVSFDTAVGFWVCSCPAGINRGLCHHLKDHDRPGKAKGKQATPQFVAPSAPLPPMPALPPSMRKPIRAFAKEEV